MISMSRDSKAVTGRLIAMQLFKIDLVGAVDVSALHRPTAAMDAVAKTFKYAMGPMLSHQHGWLNDLQTKTGWAIQINRLGTSSQKASS